MKMFGGSGSRAPGKNSVENAAPSRSNKPMSSNGRQPAKNPKKKRQGWLIALLVVVLAALAVFLYWKITTRPPESGSSQQEPGTQAQTPSSAEDRYYTTLVVGDDQEGGNTDTIMLVRFDTVEMKVNAVSIPRDTLVNSSLGNKKINAIYHNLDGMESLMDAVESITGSRPDNYIMVDTDVFVDVVDAMGGIDFDVPFDMNYDDYADKNLDGTIDYVFTIHVNAGQQKLSGYDALGVFRWRQNNPGAGGHVYTNPDIQRIEMQHNLLKAIAGKAMNTRNAATLMKIVSAVLDKCQTDLKIGNIQWYVEKFLQMSMENIEFFTMPTTGAMIKSNRDVAYVMINVDEWLDMVNKNFNTTGKDITREDCAIVYWTNPSDPVNGQYRPKTSDLATTDGSEMNTNFKIA